MTTYEVGSAMREARNDSGEASINRWEASKNGNDCWEACGDSCKAWSDSG